MALASTAIANTPAPTERPASGPGTRRRHLYNRWVDFLVLGGGSWIVMGAMAAFYPRDEESRLALAAVMMFVAHFVNHPHFAHSYQIFYSGFLRKAFAFGPGDALGRRYRFAGVMVPAVLIAFFAATLLQGSAALLGLAANAMFFTVGWHYAKQGFGILMLDSAYKGVAFDARERRNLLVNTHLSWITFYLMTNNAVAAKNYWGLSYYAFDTPDALLWTMAAVTAASLVVVARDMLGKWRRGHALPLNGIIAYITSVYVWLVLARFDPLLLLLAPAFHSLQYLGVVWRRQINVEGERVRDSAGVARAGTGSAVRWRRWLKSTPFALARFAVVGGLLGAAGFWWAPEFLDAHAGYDAALFGATAFLFMGWTFINIHHYFIDAVIWRRENADTRRYLFEA